MLILDFNWTNCLFYACKLELIFDSFVFYQYMHDDENMHVLRI
jgi:hypothetical protein